MSLLSVYCASMFVLPKHICSSIDMILKDFLWSFDEGRRGFTSVGWKDICVPKSQGGLGLRPMKFINEELMIKHLWNIVSKKDSLLVKWVNGYRLKATNIILQGLPTDIYSLVNHYRVAKDLWERVHLLMQDFHTSNYDPLHAYTEQHELYENEVCFMHEYNQDPLAFVANHQMSPPHFNTYHSSYNNPQLQPQFSPSKYGSIQPNKHYSSTYYNTPKFTQRSGIPLSGATS
nr:hypothetical protein [Tanacetum cinerariifolium]